MISLIHIYQKFNFDVLMSGSQWNTVDIRGLSVCLKIRWKNIFEVKVFL